MIESIVFYSLAVLLLFFAWKVVTTPYVVRAAVYLINMLLAVAGLYLLLNAEFVAAVQILVYVGGIVVITIFAILLTSRVGDPTIEYPRRYRVWSALASTLLVSLFVCTEKVMALRLKTPGWHPDSSRNTAKDLGQALLSFGADGFLAPFEVVSLLLLAAMLGAIVIARTKPGEEKSL